MAILDTKTAAAQVHEFSEKPREQLRVIISVGVDPGGNIACRYLHKSDHRSHGIDHEDAHAHNYDRESIRGGFGIGS